MSHKKRILLIEDEEDIAALIKLQAEVSGYKLHVEVDGINGYRAIEREKPDLVILDIMLPGQNGFDVCRKMKANHRAAQRTCNHFDRKTGRARYGVRAGTRSR